MKNIRKVVSVILIGTFLLTVTGCKMLSKTEAAIKKSPVAKVNGKEITRGELDDKMGAVMAQLSTAKIDPASDQGKSILKEQRKVMLDNLIIERIIVDKAKELKLALDDANLNEAVNKKYEEIKKGFPDNKQFVDALSQAGFNETSLKSYLKMEEIKLKVKDYITKDVKVADDKVRQVYDANPYKYTEQPNKMHAAHILTKTLEEANKAKARLDKGEPFDKVAKEVSIDTSSSQNGGDLGDMNYEGFKFGTAFLQAAAQQKNGAISKPVQTTFGFHIIKTISKKEYPVKKYETVQNQIRDELVQQEKNTLVSKTLEKWKAEAKIETKKYEKNLE